MLALAHCLVPFLLLALFSGASSDQSSKESSCPADANEKWSYRGANGPENWGDIEPDCNGKQQSPININSSAAVQSDLVKLQMNNYDVPISRASVENNGYTIKVTPHDDVQRTIEVENSMYVLRHFHFHWGHRSDHGSEHLLDNHAAALELHFVHQNEDGNLAVIGVGWLETHHHHKDDKQRGTKCNEELQKIVGVFPEVQYKNESTELTSPLLLNGLVPENPARFYRYHGSLTIPACGEEVIWSVIPQCMELCKAQIRPFRNLYSTTEDDATEGCRLVDNYRPLQPLNGRTVYKSQGV